MVHIVIRQGSQADGILAYAAEVKALEDAVLQWRGSGPSEGVYLDEDAPIIKGDNVPVRDDGHREAIAAYYKHRMTNSGR